MNSSQLINQTSGKTEWYTPPHIVDRAKLLMGGIDLDPASSELANKYIGAKKIFTIDDDGLSQKWFGRVWMNHPFSRKHNADWIAKLIREYTIGGVVEACCITYASTSEKWFRPLLSFPICFIHGRTNYIDPATNNPAKGVTKGSCITYLGDNEDKFADLFDMFGSVMFPY